jgi:AcrR family transcriptional regulator
MDMSTPYELTGRTHQKARTRMALVSAALELLDEGVNPTVEQAADRARISRTTAYRYFQNQRALLLATYPELDTPSLLDSDAPADPLVRLEVAMDHFTAQILEHEVAARAQLRLSLDPATRPEDLPFRQGRAIRWFEDALAPLRDRMSAAELRRLVLAIRSATGIEALVWLTDIAGQSREDAVELMRWSARSLAATAIAEAGKSRRR